MAVSLLPVAEAQARLLAHAHPLPVENVQLLDARGCWLAEPVAALRDQPWADLSAMDGYAIRAADMPGPWRIVGVSQAGGAPPHVALGPAEAMRIFTGAPLPTGADCILIQEEAAADGDRLTLTGEGPLGTGGNVRPRASDFAAGSPLIAEGTRIDAAQIALAAVAGYGRLPVRRRPRVAIISTGDELILPGSPVPPGKLPSSNAVMLAALIANAGAQPVDLGLFPDDLDAISAGFTGGADADIIVSTGGASVGDHDLVKPAIERAGGTIDFWRIAMRPGKPLMCGTLGETLLLGLPGNPVAAFVTAQLFLLPLIRAMSGAPNSMPEFHMLYTDIPLPPGGSRTEYLRAVAQDGRIIQMFRRDSAALAQLAIANVLIERPIGCKAAAPGDIVAVMRIAQ